MSTAKILWVDDEIDSLTSQILFLENKGYDVTTKSNGFDAIEYVKDIEKWFANIRSITSVKAKQQS